MAPVFVGVSFFVHLIVLKKTVFLILNLFVILFANSQTGVMEPGKAAGKEFSVKNCFNDKRYSGFFYSDSLKSNQVLTGQKIWRVISLDDQENKYVFNTNKGCAQVSLFEIMKFGLLEKGLNAFSSDEFKNVAATRLSHQQKVKSLTFKDSSVVVTFAADGSETTDTVVVNRYYLGSDVISFLIKEDWIFNAHSGASEKYIIAIAPLVTNRETGGIYPLFWLYYPEWKELLGCFVTMSAHSDEPLPVRQILEERKFISQISKQSNIYDRSVRSVHHGADIKINSDFIKENLNNKGADHFDH